MADGHRWPIVRERRGPRVPGCPAARDPLVSGGGPRRCGAPGPQGRAAGRTLPALPGGRAARGRAQVPLPPHPPISRLASRGAPAALGSGMRLPVRSRSVLALRVATLAPRGVSWFVPTPLEHRGTCRLSTAPIDSPPRSAPRHSPGMRHDARGRRSCAWGAALPFGHGSPPSPPWGCRQSGRPDSRESGPCRGGLPWVDPAKPTGSERPSIPRCAARVSSRRMRGWSTGRRPWVAGVSCLRAVSPRPPGRPPRAAWRAWRAGSDQARLPRRPLAWRERPRPADRTASAAKP